MTVLGAPTISVLSIEWKLARTTSRAGKGASRVRPIKVCLATSEPAKACQRPTRYHVKTTPSYVVDFYRANEGAPTVRPNKGIWRIQEGSRRSIRGSLYVDSGILENAGASFVGPRETTGRTRARKVRDLTSQLGQGWHCGDAHTG